MGAGVAKESGGQDNVGLVVGRWKRRTCGKRQSTGAGRDLKNLNNKKKGHKKAVLTPSSMALEPLPV